MSGRPRKSKDSAAAVDIVIAELRVACDNLRATAADMRAGRLNVHHAANRIDKIADSIARAREDGAT